MTYGFKFLNNSNETIIDDTNVKPWFYGQATVAYANDITNSNDYVQFNELNRLDYGSEPPNPFTLWTPDPAIVSWRVYEIGYETPVPYDCFILLNLPVTSRLIFYSCEKPLSRIGNNLIKVYAYVPSILVGTSADIPKAYIFVTNPVPTAQRSLGYGVQIRNQSGEYMFDSGKRHLQPKAYAQVVLAGLYNEYITNPGTYNNIITYDTGIPAIGSTPANAAWLLPSSDIVYGTVSNEGEYKTTHNVAVFKRKSPLSSYPLQKAQVKTFTRYTPAYSNTTGLFNASYLRQIGQQQGFTDGSGVVLALAVDATSLDQGYTGPELPQSFSLFKNIANIIEGSGNGVTITLTTTAVPNGTVVPYTITGISASDLTLNTLTRDFIVNNNTSNTFLTATNDGLFEGIETATLSLNNGRASISFTISDSVSYSLSSFMTPEEGQSIAVTLTTTNLSNGSTVPYTITGITQADLSVGTISGNFTMSSNTGSLEFRFARDSPFEYETMRISVNNGATFLDIPITDVPAGNEVLTINPSTITYNQRTTLTVTGGTPNGSFEFITTLQGEDPVYAWNNRWKPEYAPYVGTQYFDENGNFSNPPATALGPNGSDLGANPNAVSNRTFWIFTTTTKNFRSFNYTVNPEPAFFVSGTDNTQGPLYVDEGTTGYFKVTTANIPNGTVVYPKLIGGTLSAADFTNTGAGGITIQNNVATFQITFTADAFTDGQQEYAELVVQYPDGTTKNSYGNIFVSDTSLTAASYSLTKTVPTGSTADEGTAAYFYLTTNQSANLYWVLEGTGITADDIQAAGAYDADGNYYSYGAGLYGIINSTYYQLFVYFKNDVRTEGNETLTVNIKTGSQNGQTVASAVVIIGDTSLYPAAGTPSGDPFCIGVNRYQAYHNGQGGLSTAVIEYNSLICGYIPPASYSVSRYVATVNENGFQFFTIGLTSVPSGTQLWWDISGTNITTNDIQYVYHDAQDGNGWFTPSGGSTLNNTFTVYGQTSYQVIVYPRSDLQTEGTETATFNLRTGYSGGPSQASTSFDIGDTSTTPSYNESLTIVSDANNNHIVPLNGNMTISITGGAPNTTFTYNSGTLNGDPQPSSFPGVASLDGNGSFYNYITGATYRGSQSIGDMRLWVRFSNGNVRSARANIVYDAGTTSGGQYCVGYTLTQNYNDGVGGTYSQVVEYNNVATCNYTVQYTPARTRVYYTYYNFDYQGDTWGLDSGRPGGAVTGTIVDGPYAGFAISGTFNGSGQFRYPVGNYGYLSPGFYTINFTFPGQDAYYSASYRTIVAYFYVRDASAGAGGVIP
jgi:hypothetical protein